MQYKISTATHSPCHRPADSTTHNKRRLVQQGHQQTSRRGSATESQPSVCSPESVANGFLTHQFEPVLVKQYDELLPKMDVERDFFISLSHLSTAYGFQPIDTSSTVYPLNLALSYNQAVQELFRVDPTVLLAIIQDETRRAVLATYKVYNTGFQFYHIPVAPLWRLIRSKKNPQAADLLLSLYSYWLTVQNVAFYSNPSSYIYDQYEMIKEWVECDDELEIEQRNDRLWQHRRATRCGNAILKRLRQPQHVAQFYNRLIRFKPESEAEIALEKIASSVWTLSQQFPNHHLDDSIERDLLEDKEADFHIYMEQYISFVWDISDDIYESVVESLNTDFNEAGSQDEPTRLLFFDKPQPDYQIRFDFEERAFPLLFECGELTTVINQLIGLCNP
jgi:hypothetical protein